MTIDANLITGMEIGAGVGLFIGLTIFKIIDWINDL
jgi:hypothetical protein